MEKLFCPLTEKIGNPLICQTLFSVFFGNSLFIYHIFLFICLLMEIFSLADDVDKGNKVNPPPIHMRWPHMQADQVRGLSLREIGGGFTRHNRAPSIRAACYAIAKPSTMVQKMQNIKKIRGHRNAVYCGKLLIHISCT